MSPLTPARVETAFWLAVCLGLTTTIGMETDWGRHPKLPPFSVPEQHSDFVMPVLTEPYRLPPADALLETAMRPLFIVTRRPAPTIDVDRPRMVKDQFVLTGVSIVPQGKFAFLFEKAANRTRVVSEGKQINGITVKGILADQVVLTQNDDTEVLPLRTAKAPPAASPSPMPARMPMPVAAPPYLGAPGSAVPPVRPVAPPEPPVPATTRPAPPVTPPAAKPQAAPPVPAAKSVAGPN